MLPYSTITGTHFELLSVGTTSTETHFVPLTGDYCSKSLQKRKCQLTLRINESQINVVSFDNEYICNPKYSCAN